MAERLPSFHPNSNLLWSGSEEKTKLDVHASQCYILCECQVESCYSFIENGIIRPMATDHSASDGVSSWMSE